MLEDIRGSQRDLLDVVTLVDAKECPFTSIIPKGPAPDQVLMEWPVDAQEDPDDNAQVDGSDVSNFDNAQGKYQTLSGRVQWFRVAAMVGKLAQELQNQAGITNKKAYAIKKKIEQLKRIIEVRISGDSLAVLGTGATPNRTQGAGLWIQAATTNQLYPVPADFLPPSGNIYTGTIANLDENAFQAVLTSQYQQTGTTKTRTLIAGTTLKTTITGYTKAGVAVANSTVIRNYNQDVSTRKLIATVDVFVGDFGTYEIVPSLWLNYSFSTKLGDIRRGYAIDSERWSIGFKQRTQVMPLPDQGGGPRFQVDAIGGLRCHNPKDQAAFKSTS